MPPAAEPVQPHSSQFHPPLDASGASDARSTSRQSGHRNAGPLHVPVVDVDVFRAVDHPALLLLALTTASYIASVCAATIGHEKRSSTARLPASPIAAARVGSLRIVAIAFAIADGSLSTTRPAPMARTTSSMATSGLTTTGTPHGHRLGNGDTEALVGRRKDEDVGSLKECTLRRPRDGADERDPIVQTGVCDASGQAATDAFVIGSRDHQVGARKGSGRAAERFNEERDTLLL